ncbi:MAG TPA: sterol desaturase family protein [Pseudomonadales bacterium]|nr:sterol desaturase family protein [Pseudomonadales bacterium]
MWRHLWAEEFDWNKTAYKKIAFVIIGLSAVTISFNMFTYFHLLDYLGPGLGDETSFDYIRDEFNALKASGNGAAAIALASALALLFAFRCWAMLHGYIHYQTLNATYPNDNAKEGKPQTEFPINLFYTLLLFNVLMFTGVALVYSVFGGVAISMGYDFSQGYDAAKEIVAYAHQLTNAYVPTLIELPPVINVLLIYSIINFPHYWLHRLAHEYRLPWLLLHRPHHYPTTMIEPVTTNVVVAFPLGFLVMFPYVLFFGAATKLFSAEPLYLEIIILNIITNIGAVSAHHSALYYLGFKYRIIGFIGYLTGTAQYHYLHHASHPVYANHNTNLTNIGAGPCMLWDRVFGTYVKPPVSRPRIGLTGNPALHLNPLRLLMAGLVQLVYEWKSNREWPTRMKILFGKSDYTPPVSKDFAIHERGGYS